jgi:AbrB family looped-hinge helix DNA binding protein
MATTLTAKGQLTIPKRVRDRLGTKPGSQLEAASSHGPVWINDVVYAEISGRFARLADVDAALDLVGVEYRAMSRRALFLAGRAFVQDRRNGGPRGSLLPNFFIGAHAAADGLVRLTRDPRRHRTYFRSVVMITPPE